MTTEYVTVPREALQAVLDGLDDAMANEGLQYAPQPHLDTLRAALATPTNPCAEVSPGEGIWYGDRTRPDHLLDAVATDDGPVHQRGEFVMGLGWSCVRCDTFDCPTVQG